MIKKGCETLVESEVKAYFIRWLNVKCTTSYRFDTPLYLCVRNGGVDFFHETS